MLTILKVDFKRKGLYMFKFIYELATDPLGLPIEWYYELFILWIIDQIAYSKAYNNVRGLYREGFISGSVLGSLCHWIIRIFHFVVMWGCTYSVIWVGKFVVSHKFEVGIGVIIILSTVAVIKFLIWNNQHKELVMAKVRNEKGNTSRND